MTSGHYGNFPAPKNHPIQTIVFKSYISFKSFLKVFEKGLIGGAKKKKKSTEVSAFFVCGNTVRVIFVSFYSSWAKVVHTRPSP